MNNKVRMGLLISALFIFLFLPIKVNTQSWKSELLEMDKPAVIEADKYRFKIEIEVQEPDRKFICF